MEIGRISFANHTATKERIIFYSSFVSLNPANRTRPRDFPSTLKINNKQNKDTDFRENLFNMHVFYISPRGNLMNIIYLFLFDKTRIYVDCFMYNS